MIVDTLLVLIDDLTSMQQIELISRCAKPLHASRLCPEFEMKSTCSCRNESNLIVLAGVAQMRFNFLCKPQNIVAVVLLFLVKPSFWVWEKLLRQDFTTKRNNSRFLADKKR